MNDQRRGRSVAPDGLSQDEWVNYCWADMKRRWQHEQPVFVEDYLPANHPHAISPEAMIDLIYAEYIMRKEHGQSPDHAEYLERFPELAERLARQFALDDALSSDMLYELDSTFVSGSGDARADSDAPPERIGKYIVVGQIGTGGQAEIYRAVHPGLNKEVVLKLAKNTPGLPAARRQQLEAEARILASIEHPHLARVYDLDFYQDRPYLVMEFIRGRTLDQYCRQENPSADDCALLLAKIARALAAVHRHSIVHLDIKPANVLVDDQGEPRIIDFGLALLAGAWHEDVLEASSIRGTLHFMSPEQAKGDTANVDFRSDIFALGGLLYFLLTKQPPYRKGKLTELLQRIRNCEWDQEPLFHRNIPPALRNTCLQAMDEDPDRRHATAETFAKSMDQFRHGARRFTKPALALAALLLVALTVVGANRGWWFSGPPRGGPENGQQEPPIILDNDVLAKRRAFKSSLTIEVWETDRFLRLADIAPLRNDDRLRITADIPAGMYFSLWLLTSEGELQELLHGKAAAQPLKVHYPKRGKAIPIVGPPGTEMVLVCARRAGPLDLTDVQDAWRDQPSRLPLLPGQSVLRADAKGVSVALRERGFGPPVDRPDPESIVHESLERLRQGLIGRVEYFEAIAFSHQP